MVEGEWREHGAVAVDVGFDEQSGAADAVEVDDVLRVAVDVCEWSLVRRFSLTSSFSFLGSSSTYHPRTPSASCTSPSQHNPQVKSHPGPFSPPVLAR